MAQIVLNDVLCYLASSKNSIPKDVILKSDVSLYDEDAITRANDELFKLCTEKNVAKKSCSSKQVENFLDLFSKKDDNPYVLPTFAANGFNSMPPAGLDIIAPVIKALRDEIASLKFEVSEQRRATQRDVRLMEHLVSIKLDFDDIEKFIHELCDHRRNNFDMFARIVSGPDLNCSNEPRHISERITSMYNPKMKDRAINCLMVKLLRTLYLSLPTFRIMEQDLSLLLQQYLLTAPYQPRALGSLLTVPHLPSALGMTMNFPVAKQMLMLLSLLLKVL